jgi:2,3-bisphosphoglycerate-independent phosphoglycerate mutase
MDTKKLIKAIQLIIKEEVRKEVAKEKKALRKSLMNEIKKSQPQVVEKDPFDVGHIFKENVRQPKPQQEKSYTSNSTLNDMLNETAESGEWRSINSNGVGNGVFQSSQAQSFGGGVGQEPQVLQNVDGRTVSTDQLQQTDAGKAVVDALTRDYSGLMKHMNKKKGS